MRSKIRRFYPVIVLALLLVLWEVLVVKLEIKSYVLPAPSKVLSMLWTDRDKLLHHSQVTVLEALYGMGISLVAAVLLGIIMDASEGIRASLYPVLVVTQTIPMIVLSPILILYLGLGPTPRILTVVLMCFFPVVVSFVDGMQKIEPAYVNLVRSYGGSWLQVYTQVKIPYALPALFSGLKVAATYSVSGAVVGEWVASSEGIGYYLIKAKKGYALDKMFACVLIIIVLSLLMNGLIRLLQWLCLPYTHKKRGGTKR